MDGKHRFEKLGNNKAVQCVSLYHFRTIEMMTQCDHTGVDYHPIYTKTGVDSKSSYLHLRLQTSLATIIDCLE